MGGTPGSPTPPIFSVLGTIKVARCCLGRLYCITGRYNQKIYSQVPDDIVEPVDPLIVRHLRRRPDYSPSIEFQLLFGKLHERMTTNKGRELAQERYTYMRDFFGRLRKEIEGEL